MRSEPATVIRMRTLLSSVMALTLVGTTGCTANDDPRPAALQGDPAPPTDDDATLPIVHLSPAFPRLKFYRPIFLTHAGDGTDRVFIVEQNGRIRVVENRSRAATAPVFLDIRSKVRSTHNEEGLLGLAFHPRYKDNGELFVYYTASNPQRGVLSRFRVDDADASRADRASEEVLLEVAQPFGNHNGATVLFGPDGYLYLSLGDGGARDDPHDNAQDLTTLLGTIIRIDIDARDGDRPYRIPADNPFVGRSDARGETWAYGLRNVWRMSFDRETGDLWAADVGQDLWEEIDLITRGGNYGWRRREGKHRFRLEPLLDDAIDPIVEYPRSKGISVTGGYVYRGARFPALRGVYLYADYVSGRIWGVRHEDGKATAHGEVLEGKHRRINSFGEDAAGELYVCVFDRLDGTTGHVFKVLSRE